MALQPYPTITADDPQTLMDAINAIARIRLQDIAQANSTATTVQNVATTGCIACTATGTNTIALQQNANQTVISGYTNYQQFSFVAANNSSGNVTVNVNGIGALNLYKSDGATQAGSGDLTAGALCNITSNSALNSAAGGFQITSGASSVPIATDSVAGIVIPDGTVITVDGSGHITVPDATSSALGVVKPDGTIITVSSGAITVAKASSSAFGVVEVDGTTITASSGVIKANYTLMTAYAVGSIVIATPEDGVGNTPVAAGATFAGSALTTVDVDSLSGTWKTMQKTTTTAGSTFGGQPVIWQRIA